MDKKQTKELSIKIWEWLYNNPSKSKHDLPDEIDYDCPLCDLYEIEECEGCPLYEENASCLYNHSYYRKWYYSIRLATRKKYAGLILNIIKEWKI